MLSTTAKVRARVGRKNAKDGVPETPKAEEKKGDVEMEDEEKKKEEEKVKEPEVEPDFQELKNPSRVLKA